jgi:hypothetical protein
MGWAKRIANNILGVAVIVISNQAAEPSMACCSSKLSKAQPVEPARVTVLLMK